VIVFGIGTIGILVVQCLLLAGVKDIIAVDISDKKLADAREVGCKYTIKPKNEDLKERVFAYTNGLGADIALECAGSKITQEQCLLVTK
ncbi:zinc-binding dehydrogenase, partial [Escherichia coli]|nr:zinc-binding dehydrogenase [Escherichia coli]